MSRTATEHLDDRRLAKPMFMLAMIAAGSGAVDMLTGIMLPVTMRHFTADAAFIGVMLAFNRLFGFLVQPYVAWRGDHARSRLGRRRAWLLLGYPLTLLAVLTLGALPHLITGEARTLLWAITAVFVTNLVLQAALDVTYGSLDPLYGDTFRPDRLGRAGAWRNYVGIGMSFLLLYVLVPLADRNEFIPYAGVAALLGVAWFFSWRFREDPTLPLAPRETYNPLKPLARLRDPSIRRGAIIGAAALSTNAVGGLFHSLYVTEKLGLTLTDLGHASVVSMFVSIAVTYPCGRLIDRYGPRPALIAGFGSAALLGVVTTLFLRDRTGLYVLSSLGATGSILMMLGIAPMVYGAAAPERRGEVFGTVQATRAATATLVTLLGGKLAQLSGDYRATYLLGAALALVGLWFAFQLPARASKLVPDAPPSP
jgi:Na+/melibiose symporter-like transporter